MPIDDLQQAAQKIAEFLSHLNKLGGFRFKYRITAGDGAHDPQGAGSAGRFTWSWAARMFRC